MALVTQNSKGHIYYRDGHPHHFPYSYWCANCNNYNIASENWDYTCDVCGEWMLSITKQEKSRRDLKKSKNKEDFII